MSHLSEQDLILMYYGEPDEAEGARVHLQQCPQCGLEARALREALERMDSVAVPEPRPGLEKEMWSKLVPEVSRSKRENTIGHWNWKWVPALGLAMALLAGVMASLRQPAAPAGLSDTARQRILAMSLADHLDRTQMVLTELENAPDTVPGELERLRVRAQDLVEESRLMRQWLENGQQDGALAVVEEANRVLTEAANAAGGPQDVELLAQAQTIAGQGQFEQARIQAEAARAMSSAVRDGVAFQLAKGLTTSYGGGSYDGGTRALDDKRYEDAIRQFDGVINGKSPRADGALYWKAYALDRAGRKDEALAALARLRADYPQSRWLNDAQALESTVKQGSGQPASAATEANQDLKLMAINSLMNADPERAVPLLEGILKGSGAPRVKDRALFVLTQSKAPRASQLLNDYAKGAGNPDMQNRAIRYLGMSGSPEAQQQLSGIYTASTDIPVKREIIRSLIMSRATEQIFNLAKTEKEPELRLEAIRQLGAMRASSQLLQLYASEATADNKINIVRSLMAAGAGDKLMELAKSEKDVKVRGEVVRSMAMTRGTPIEAILQFYSAETDAKIRRDLINGLSNRGEVKTLVDLARKETDPALKKTIVERLSMSKAKEATDYMMELLK